MKGITSIEVTPSWGQSPARTRRRTGEVFINEDYLPAGWKYLPAVLLEKMLWAHPKWKFILRHEEGHIALNTSNEDLADDYASRKYFADGGSHKKSVKALAEVLPMNTPQHHTRVRNQVLRAAQDDCKRNNHKPSCMLVETILGTTIGTLTAKAIDGGITATRENFLVGGDNYSGASVYAPINASVGLATGVSVMDEFSPVDCGTRPVAVKCDGGPLKRRRCNDGNKATLDAWNKCNAQNNQAAKEEIESKAFADNVNNELTKVQLSSDTALKLQLAQAKADQAALAEETKQQAQSKTPLVLITIAIVAGFAIAMYFLFKTPAPTV